MTSLFSPFDMNHFFLCFLFLAVSLFVIVGLSFKISFFGFSFGYLFSNLVNFFLTLKPKMFNKVSTALFMSIFILVLLGNFLSVFCFNFPLTSQVSTIMTLSLGVWMSLIIFSIMKNLKGFTSHLVPEGTPLPLTILLFIIELVSNIIRPLTLMVRLVANILAGHLLMSLLSSLVFNFSLAFFFYLLLNLVELMVALIQAYIFTTMTVLYFSEV